LTPRGVIISAVPSCPLCSISNDDTWAVGEHALAVPPSSPVTPAHCIVVPRRHVARFYDLDVEEQRGVWDLVRDMRRQLWTRLKLNQFRIGFADFTGEEGHAHVHVIPCQAGEQVELPRDLEWVKDDSASL
jgi:diadenosine tetraphosphate (Ap4A) HIT family hydrolase